jgi:anti-sigma regulatory factor (Ser/Thr protein kinase)
MARPNRSMVIDSALIALVKSHPRDLVSTVAHHTEVSRAAVAARARQLIKTGILEKEGTTRPVYRPGLRFPHIFQYRRPGLAEDRVWRQDVLPLLNDLPDNVLYIVEYGLTEMVNNAIDHSDADDLLVAVSQDEATVYLAVIDNGVGIFRKITKSLNLPDERLALLELSKGKFTTDPARHSGEGIFFTSRMFDWFDIRAGELMFSHDMGVEKDILTDVPADFINVLGLGTAVRMGISRNSPRKAEDVFAEYSSGPDEYAFAKTVVPVRMAKLGDENLISRSQAKRVLQGVNRFRHIVFDFAGVERIGQAFADEIFRVFAMANPDIELESVHAAGEIQQMIRRAEVLRDEQQMLRGNQ